MRTSDKVIVAIEAWARAYEWKQHYHSGLGVSSADGLYEEWVEVRGAARELTAAAVEAVIQEIKK